MYSPINVGPHLVEIIRTFEAAHPACRVRTIDTSLDRDARDWLRSEEADVLATRLPLSDPDMVIGPMLSDEPRLLAVATDHELASRQSVTVEDLVDYTLPDHLSFPREMMDSFVPPRTSSGRSLHRIEVRSFTDALMRVANGELVQPTVGSFIDYHAHPGVTSVPIRDLPPSQTALVWLAGTETATVRAFAQTAEAVIRAHAQAQPGR